jgi:hypothetical protein
MTKVFGDIAKSVGFISMNSLIQLRKALDECFTPGAVEFAESLSHQTIEFQVRALLRTTFNYHVAEFNL